jgi:uncharacterized protein YkwD
MRIRRFFGFAGMALCAVSLGAVSLGVGSAAQAAIDADALVNRALDLINAERAQHGCGPLTIDPRLNQAALRQSEAMARQHFFDHKDPDGTTPGQRVRDTGYVFQMMGENIEAGTDTAEEAVRVWMKSPGHRANILTCAYKETGLALVDARDDVPMNGQSMAYEYYWTQEFALPMKAEK